MSEQENKKSFLNKFKNKEFKMKVYLYLFIISVGFIVFIFSNNNTHKKISVEKVGKDIVNSGIKTVTSATEGIKNNSFLPNETKEKIEKKRYQINSNEISNFLKKMKKEREESLKKIKKELNFVVDEDAIKKDNELMDIEEKIKEGYLPQIKDSWREKKYIELQKKYEIKEKKEKIKENEKLWDNFIKKEIKGDHFLEELKSESNIESNNLKSDIDNSSKNEINKDYLPKIKNKNNINNERKIKEIKNNDKDVIIDEQFKNMFNDLY